MCRVDQLLCFYACSRFANTSLELTASAVTRPPVQCAQITMITRGRETSKLQLVLWITLWTEFYLLRSVKACLEISAIRNVWAAASRAIVQWKNGACLIEDSDGSSGSSGELAFPLPVWTRGAKLVRMREPETIAAVFYIFRFCCLALSSSVFLASNCEKCWGRWRTLILRLQTPHSGRARSAWHSPREGSIVRRQLHVLRQNPATRMSLAD